MMWYCWFSSLLTWSLKSNVFLYLCILLSLFFSAADFLKYFQTEDHKVQDRGKENIQVDLLSSDHLMQEKSNSDEDSITLMNLPCPGNMIADTINSSKN